MEKEKIGIIYRCLNLKNNKCYIGKTIQKFKKYCRSHVNAALRKTDYKCKKPRKFYNAIRKYGKDSFKWEVLEKIPVKHLNEREKFYIKKYNSLKLGYNETLGGDGCSGRNPYKRTPEIRERISKALKGKKRSQDSIERQRKTMSGPNHPLYGKGHSAEAIEKMKRAKKGIKNPIAKIFEIISPSGQKYIVKGGLNSFCTKYHLWHNAISSVARGEKDHHKNWKVREIPKVIENAIGPTAEIVAKIKPVHNMKDSGHTRRKKDKRA